MVGQEVPERVLAEPKQDDPDTGHPGEPYLEGESAAIPLAVVEGFVLGRQAGWGGDTGGGGLSESQFARPERPCRGVILYLIAEHVLGSLVRVVCVVLPWETIRPKPRAVLSILAHSNEGGRGTKEGIETRGGAGGECWGGGGYSALLLAW